MLVALERVAADQLGETIGLVSVRGPDRPHLVEDDADAAFSELKCGFGSSDTSSDDGDLAVQALF